MRKLLRSHRQMEFATVSLFLLMVAVLPSAGCFRHIVEERQLGNTAFLVFPRLQSEAKVTLSGPRKYEFQVSTQSQTRYEVEAGQYRVTIARGDTLVADRLIYLGAGEVKEVDAR